VIVIGRRLRQLRQSEIEHLHGAIRPHLDIRRLEVAMDDRLLVRRLERLPNLPCDRQRLVERDCALRDAVSQRRSLDEFHHERRHTRCALQPVDVRDLGVVQ
jgi:hypothetical protein